MTDQVCIHCIVSGRVQGVWYRSATQQQARALNVRGRAINLNNGDVEVIACGTQAAVEALQTWLWRGPEHAKVESVNCKPFTKKLDLQGFITG